MDMDALDWQQRKEERLLMDARADAYEALHALDREYEYGEETYTPDEADDLNAYPDQAELYERYADAALDMNDGDGWPDDPDYDDTYWG